MMPKLTVLQYLEETSGRYTKNKMYPCAKFGNLYVICNDNNNITTLNKIREGWWKEIEENKIGGKLV